MFHTCSTSVLILLGEHYNLNTADLKDPIWAGVAERRCGASFDFPVGSCFAYDASTVQKKGNHRAVARASRLIRIDESYVVYEV